MDTLEREIVVEYKDETSTAGGAPTNPVSETDRAIEALLRERIAERFPDHGVIGEEVGGASEADREFVWVLDPVDGTANFINGFRSSPARSACCIAGGPSWARSGAPRRTRCGRASTTRARAARCASRVSRPRWDGPAAVSAAASGLRRAEPPAACGGWTRGSRDRPRWSAPSSPPASSNRRSSARRASGTWPPGSASCASSGRVALSRNADGWGALERFAPPASVPDGRTPTIRDWRQPLILGVEEEATTLLRSTRNLRWWLRLRGACGNACRAGTKRRVRRACAAVAGTYHEGDGRSPAASGDRSAPPVADAPGWPSGTRTAATTRPRADAGPVRRRRRRGGLELRAAERGSVDPRGPHRGLPAGNGHVLRRHPRLRRAGRFPHCSPRRRRVAGAPG